MTLTDEEPEAWRGEIRDGEVVRTHEEAMEEEEDEAGDGGPEDQEGRTRSSGQTGRSPKVTACHPSDG